MAKYKLLEKSLFDKMYDVGDEITVDDSVIPGPHMVPLDKPAKTAFAAAGWKQNYEVGDQVDDITATTPTDENPLD